MIKSQSEPFRDVSRTLALMATMAQEQKTDPKVRKVTDSVTAGIDLPPGRQERREIATRVWRFIKREIRYMNDPVGAELVQAPDAVLKTRHADCDGMATLAAAMLAAIGIESGFRAVAWDVKGQFEHVYAIYAPARGAAVSRWHALDTVSPSPPPGEDTIRDDAVEVKDLTLAEHSTDSQGKNIDMAQLLSEGQSSRALGRRPLGETDNGGDTSDTPFDSVEDFVQYAIEKGPEYVAAWRQSGDSPAPNVSNARLRQLEQRIRNLQQGNEAGLGSAGTLAVSGIVAAGIVYVATR